MMFLHSKIFYPILTFALLVLIPFHSGWAQSTLDDLIITEEKFQPVKDNYPPVTLEGLTKLYWAIGKLDLTDDEAIDNFMLINECDLYTQFYHDDIEWKKLHNATRAYISENITKFPTRFEYMIPITLGRYDIETQKFQVDDESSFVNVRRLDIRTVSRYLEKRNGPDCFRRNKTIENYEDKVILVLNQPFTFVEFEAQPELADMYLTEAKSYYERLPPSLQISRYERLAYLRLKFRVTTFKDYERTTGGHLVPVVLGYIEGFEVFADSQKLKPLYKQDITDKRRPRRRKKKIIRPVEPMENPNPKVDFSE